LHKPLGTQSCSGVVARIDESWRMRTRARRCSVPVAVRCIGGPPGTITGGPPRTPDLLAIRSLQTGLSSLGVPSLWPSMRVCRRYHARRKDRLHVLGRIGLTCGYRKWADFSNAFTAGRPPSLVRNREQPNLSKRLDDGAAGSSCCFRIGPGRVSIEVPKGLRLGKLPDRLMGDYPTPYFACTLGNRPANLRRRFLARKKQRGTHQSQINACHGGPPFTETAGSNPFQPIPPP
jgi:hypothetical protein